MLRAATDDDAVNFMHLLWDIILTAQSRTRSRVALACSSFATFLDVMRTPRSRCINIFYDNMYVHLGQEVSPQWAVRMSDDMKRAMVAQCPSSPLSSPYLTSALVVATIQQERNKLNLRPAIIQQLLSNFDARQASNGSFEDVSASLSKALAAIARQVDEEFTLDLMLALASNDRSFFQTLRLLADGITDASKCFIDDYTTKEKFLALLCGQNHGYFLPSTFSTLLPPYAHLCKELILPCGSVALDFSNPRKSRMKFLPVRFHCIVNLFADCIALDLLNTREKSVISKIVIELLHSHGIHTHDSGGAVIPVRSVFDHPLLADLHCASLRHQPGKLEEERAAYDAWKSRGARGSPSKGAVPPVGMQILIDLCSLEGREGAPAHILLVHGWRPIVLEELVIVAARCLWKTKLPLDKSDLGFFPVLRLAEAVEKAKARELKKQNRGLRSSAKQPARPQLPTAAADSQAQL
jgi:hypothetical protein